MFSQILRGKNYINTSKMLVFHVIIILSNVYNSLRKCMLFFFYLQVSRESGVENLEKHTQNTSQNSDTCFYIPYKRFSHATDEPTSVSARCCVHQYTFPNASLILVYAMYRAVKVCIFHTTPKRYHD